MWRAVKAFLWLAWLCIVQGTVIGIVVAAVLILPASVSTKIVIGAGLLMGIVIVMRLGTAVEHLRKIEIWSRGIFTSYEMARSEPDSANESATTRLIDKMRDEQDDAAFYADALTNYRFWVGFIAVVSGVCFIFALNK